MKVSRNPMFSFMTAAIVLGASSFASAQATAPAPPSQQPAAKPPAQSQPAMQTMTMQGELVSVDTDEKTFIVMGSASAASTSPAPAAGAPAAGAPATAPAARSSAANQNVEFKYDDDTQVSGSQTRIEGLASAKASRVTVHYRDVAGEKVATRIEVQAASSTPSSTPTPGASAPKPPASNTPNPPAAPGAPPQPGAPR
jgi:hypothetical protein